MNRFSTLACRWIGLSLLAGLLAPTASRAGDLEPFLARLAAGGEGKREIRPSPLFAWDRAEAERSRSRVLIHRTDGTAWERLRATVGQVAPGSAWEGEAGEFGQVVLDWNDLQRVAYLPEVLYVLRPPRPVPCAVRSEGLDRMEVPSFQDLGYDGRNARIGILDLGFDGYENLLGTELPHEVTARSFFRSPAGEGDITGGGEDHGTACAEIAYDIAPGARFFFANAESPIDLKAAVDWLVGQKVTVISHSIGWYFGSLDGAGPINDVAAGAAADGIVWVNAAGNEAERHTWAYAVDADGNDLLEFEAADERIDFQQVASGQTLAVALLWDLWPLSTSLDFVIEFVDGEDQVFASSEEDFTGYPYAFRYLEWTSRDGRTIGVRVRRKRGSIGGRTIHLFRIGSGTRMEDHPRSDRSLLVPADSPSVLAVGATYWETEQLDSYSSRGAIRSEPVKPELCGPVGVSTRTYGTGGFRGTSAAAPHVAGAVALVASAGLSGAYYDILWPRGDLELLLSIHAKRADYIQPLAWGIVRMPSRPLSQKVRGPLLLGNPAAGLVRWSAPCEEIEVIDAVGRTVARPRATLWDGSDSAGRRLPAGVYWVRCPGHPGVSRLNWLGR